MNRLLPSPIAVAALAVLALFVCAERAQAADISGTISSTVTITEDNELVGDVTCAVPMTLPGATPCLAFGADHIKLILNGHTITGAISPPTRRSPPSDSNVGVAVQP